MRVQPERKPDAQGWGQDAFFDLPKTVPFFYFDREYARERAHRNHDQTPERLNERGGLGANEIVCILGELPPRALSWLRGEVGVVLFRAMFEPYDDYGRVSGEACCSICNRLYREHPGCPQQLSNDARPFLKVLCNGKRVKL